MSDPQRELADVESAPFLDDDEAKGPSLRSASPARSGGAAARSGFWTLVYHCLRYILVGVLSFALGTYFSTSETREKSLLPSQSIFSKVSSKLVLFQPDERYNDDPLGPDGLSSPWNKLSPAGKGHVRVEDPSAWKLSGGYPLNDKTYPAAEEYTISVFHQLHCLAAIKSKVSKLQDWYHGENDKEYLAFALSQEHMRDHHIYHCIDYIRQSIMCCGDTTLEKARTVDGKVVRGVDGWGVEHQCRDFEAILAYGEAHATNNDTGID